MERIEKDNKMPVKPMPLTLDEINEYRKVQEVAKKIFKVEPLSIRELEVLGMVSAGASNSDIAEQLSISEDTVKAHIRNIMDKMHFRKRDQALASLAISKEKSKSTKEYLVVFEKTKNNYSAYSPDLPGCIATGKTRQETEKNIREAIKFHLEGLKEEGLNLPEPSSDAKYVEV
jgi:DNA-binding CsgD family transcriptional regulator/predicted RNase H-like HicB family nuclease